MTAHALLTDLQRQGFTLRPLAGGRVEVSPASKLPQELREQLRQCKGEVLALLNPRPYINDRGELIIPFASDPRYHWWAGGQSIAETLAELNAPPEVWRRYVAGYTETVQ